MTRSISKKKLIVLSGAVGGKTGKTLVLPQFSEIKRGGGSVPQCYGGLTLPGRGPRRQHRWSWFIYVLAYCLY